MHCTDTNCSDAVGYACRHPAGSNFKVHRVKIDTGGSLCLLVCMCARVCVSVPVCVCRVCLCVRVLHVNYTLDTSSVFVHAHGGRSTDLSFTLGSIRRFVLLRLSFSLTHTCAPYAHHKHTLSFVTGSDSVLADHPR